MALKSKNKKEWQEWMGYTVHYVFDGQSFVEPATTHGIPRTKASSVMKSLLERGLCSYIKKVDPGMVEEIPF
jgi:hypothetical protein